MSGSLLGHLGPFLTYSFMKNCSDDLLPLWFGIYHSLKNNMQRFYLRIFQILLPQDEWMSSISPCNWVHQRSDWFLMCWWSGYLVRNSAFRRNLFLRIEESFSTNRPANPVVFSLIALKKSDIILRNESEYVDKGDFFVLIDLRTSISSKVHLFWTISESVEQWMMLFQIFSMIRKWFKVILIPQIQLSESLWISVSRGGSNTVYHLVWTRCVVKVRKIKMRDMIFIFMICRYKLWEIEGANRIVHKPSKNS